ncbi:hypothetical protein ACSBR1_001829 [Camellia fascicularis]
MRPSIAYSAVFSVDKTTESTCRSTEKLSRRGWPRLVSNLITVSGYGYSFSAAVSVLLGCLRTVLPLCLLNWPFVACFSHLLVAVFFLLLVVLCKTPILYWTWFLNNILFGLLCVVPMLNEDG